jgi:hypothetical protein
MATSIFLLIISLLLIWFSIKSKINYKQIIFEVSLVLFGFSLAMVWDNCKTIKVERREKKSLVTMIQFELAQINGAITNNIQTIEANLEAIEKNKEIIRPLMPLNTIAWESAKLRNTIFIENTGDLFKLVNLYTAAHIINEKIRFRENYRLFNQAMPNYRERIGKIDRDIKQALEKIKGLLTIAQEFIHKNTL